VMGFKKLKAIVADREPARRITVADREHLSRLREQIFHSIVTSPRFKRYYEWGTSVILPAYARVGLLPVKNYTTNEIPADVDKFYGPYYRPRFQAKPNPCWGCRMHHCHTLKVTEGPYAGYVGEEPEYEQWASWSSQIGQNDLGAAMLLSNEVDDLGMDTNEASWVIGLAIEWGIVTKKDTDGLEMTWGNVEAVRAMLHKIARRQGIGDLLAEGTKRAALAIGKEAPNMGIYTQKGTTPRAHDDRGNWLWMFDHCTSNTGVSETMGGANLSNPNYTLDINTLSPTEVPMLIAARKGIVQFEDSLVLCLFSAGPYLEPLVEMVNAATGWNLTVPEAVETGLRIVNLMRAFNLRHGISAELDTPSPRHGSAPIDGPIQGKTVLPVWRNMVERYYQELGWDRETGRPLRETLDKLQLGHVANDLWGSSLD
jgi:aldehyde:ferredoxin oxidoreductase